MSILRSERTVCIKTSVQLTQVLFPVQMAKESEINFWSEFEYLFNPKTFPVV